MGDEKYAVRVSLQMWQQGRFNLKKNRMHEPLKAVDLPKKVADRIVRDVRSAFGKKRQGMKG